MEQTRAELDLNQLIRVYQRLLDAQHLDFYAYDSSACIAEYACNQFYFAGKRAQIYRDTNMQGLNASIPATGHVAILLSHTGRNARLVALAKLLRRNGTPVIAITCSRQCQLADAASEALVAVTLRDQITSSGCRVSRPLPNTCWTCWPVWYSVRIMPTIWNTTPAMKRLAATTCGL